MEYQDLNDYELINYISENIEEANDIIMKKYYPLVTSLSNKMYTYVSNCGVDKGDLIQEGMLGLTNAINNFKDKKDTSFYTYAKTCIERNLISFVISSNRKKHQILNESLSYDNPDLIMDKILKDDNDPLDIMINKNEVEIIEEKIKSKLTSLESQVFELMLSGFKYKEIADILDKDIKSIDNAIQRIRMKSRAVLKNN